MRISDWSSDVCSSDLSKFAYGYSRYSLLFSPPLFEGRVLGSAPDRGDVAVFRWPRDPSVDYIKRVVGLPGDRLQMRDGVLLINGEPVKRRRVEDFERRDRFGNVQERRSEEHTSELQSLMRSSYAVLLLKK